MSLGVSTSASLVCSFGLAPATLAAAPGRRVIATTPACAIGDAVPAVDVPPFGMCTSLANPAVASATAAALGVLTPMPCVPVPAGPWAPGSSKVLVQGLPALDQSSKLACSFGGVIQVVTPGQFKVVER